MDGGVRGSAQVSRPPGEPGAPMQFFLTGKGRVGRTDPRALLGWETRGFRAAERAREARNPTRGAGAAPKTKACLQDPQSSKEPVSATDFDVSLSN